MHQFQSLDQYLLAQGVPSRPYSCSSAQLTELKPTHGISFAEPCIDLVKEAGRLKAIHVTCSCGQVMRLDCEYPASNL